MIDIFTLLWIGWLLYFVVVEGVALFNGARSGDTLSEHVWQWFGIARTNSGRTPSGWTRARRFALLAFVVWLAVHFLTGGWA